MTMQDQVTAVIKAKNESHQIEDAIRSAYLLADRVLVVDDSSSDDTAALARACGATVLMGLEHNGHIDLLDRQGFSAVKSGWILRMDADERMTPELAAEAREIIELGNIAGIRYARLHVMFGAPVYFGGWFEPFQLGIFRSDSWDKNWTAATHSQVPVFGEIRTVNPKVASSVHFDYDNIPQFVERSLLRYAEIDAASRFNAGQRFKLLDLLLQPWMKFFGRLIIRQGFRDGHRGLVLAALLASYQICVACNMWYLGLEHD